MRAQQYARAHLHPGERDTVSQAAADGGGKGAANPASTVGAAVDVQDRIAAEVVHALEAGRRRDRRMAEQHQGCEEAHQRRCARLKGARGAVRRAATLLGRHVA